MKKRIGIVSALLGLFGLGTLQVEAQSLPSEVTVFATATAQTDVNGQVAVSSEETTDPAYQDSKAEGVFQSTGYTMTQALPAGGLYVYAYYYAQPNDGYYFDHWVKVETGEVTSISIKDLANGLYTLKLTTDNGTSMHKIIKK